jgi:hypothetical protein
MLKIDNNKQLTPNIPDKLTKLLEILEIQTKGGKKRKPKNIENKKIKRKYRHKLHI